MPQSYEIHIGTVLLQAHMCCLLWALPHLEALTLQAASLSAAPGAAQTALPASTQAVLAMEEGQPEAPKAARAGQQPANTQQLACMEEGRPADSTAGDARIHLVSGKVI